MFVDDQVVDVLLRGTLLSFFGLLWIILLVRIVGLRSFSKMTNFDFVMTVAMGSLLAGASQSKDWAGFVQTATAMASLFAVQYCVARLRKSSEQFEKIVQNKPVLLMKDGIVQQDALRKTRVSRNDLMAKLREANVLDQSQVRAVVLETTGDISVLHGEDLDDDLLTGVRAI
ncbi:DUF421 domain-containing protein [Pontibaca salina]|uniref:DUF421 domain-containing protein n=1 Tax=Pontibaca salina TaxID=2795731 RepID=A0A934M160_9RHOB|nr:YetF domain-containing protein [Pontibaca salina]MBI6630448.1 DUF421 domain-containing protein [Pontibaca salina]